MCAVEHRMETAASVVTNHKCNNSIAKTTKINLPPEYMILLFSR